MTKPSAASQSITFTKSSTTATPKHVTLLIKDFTTDLIIPGASVTVTGGMGYSFSGVSDPEGKVTLGILQPGTYELIATATGYQNSNTDFLANDKFTV